MKKPSLFSFVAATFVILVWSMIAARAQTTPTLLYHVTIDTSQLTDHPAQPFSLELVLVDGSGSGTGSSSIVLTNFNFSTNGDVDGDPDLEGNASGDLSTNILLTTSSGDAHFIEEFTPGSTLKFDMQVTLTLNTNGISDEFDLSILDSEGQRIPTLDVQTENVLIRMTTTDGASITLETYPTDASLDPYASGPPLLFGPLVLLDGMSPPPAPLLSIQLNPDETVNLQWPESYDNFVLESSPDLINWDYMALSPGTTNFLNTNNFIVNTIITNAPEQFYRLSQ
jgi:hypothetical protein